MTIYILLQALDAESSEANGAHSLLHTVIVSLHSKADAPAVQSKFLTNDRLDYIYERWKKEQSDRRQSL